MWIGLTLDLALALTAVVASGPAPRRFEATETHMGSPFKILLYTADDATATRALRLAFDRIKALDKALSDYDPESELMRLCDRSGGPPVPVSPDLFDVLSRAKAMAERSDGAFDPTMAPVGRLWRRARRDKQMPDPATLRKALSLVGHRKMTLDPQSWTVRLDPGVRLDLGGIAKGHASQAAVDVLKAQGVPIALVAGAGDIVAGDPPPGSRGWSVDIASLDAPGTGPPERTILLANAAVSTSGDAERFVEIGGVRYSHIVDPRTGLGLTGRVSVTVIAPDGATADALDTAACVLGPERGLKLVAGTPGAEVLFVRRTEAGAVERSESTGFSRRAGPACPSP